MISSVSTLKTRRARAFDPLPWIVVPLTLAVFASAILLASQRLRRQLQEHIATHDSQVLHAAAMVQNQAAEANQDTRDLLEDPLGQLSLLLEITRNLGFDFLAVRLFDSTGQFIMALPETASARVFDRTELAAMADFKPASKYLPKVRLGEFDGNPENTNQAAVLEVAIPLKAQASTNLIGVAQFVILADHITAQSAALNAFLRTHNLLFFGAGSVVICLALTWAFYRLQRTNRLLAERSADLTRANHELTLAAKTSALGAITAHLIHGLKNPLFGLQSFVSRQGSEEGSEEWQQARDTARRMQDLISQVVSILQEEDQRANYELSLEEIGDILEHKFAPLAKELGVRFEILVQAKGSLPSREANLVILILSNLLTNSFQASERGRLVELKFSEQKADTLCEVRDQGNGLPEQIQETLFTPSRSTKQGGTGLGLAISKQLANHIGAELLLKSTSAEGTLFQLRLPSSVLYQKT